MDLSILPECYVDTNLIETIAPPGKHYNHKKGCGTVIKTMKETFSDAFALGIIDKDKKELDYLAEFAEVCKKESLELYKHKEKHHYIIRISPAIERFILKSASETGISLPDFQLPDDFEDLKKIAKSTTSKRDYRFSNLFRQLMTLEAPEIVRLGRWVSYLRDQNYKADMDKLKEF